MSYKTISSADIKTTRSVLNQLVDFIEEDISGSSTRKKYQVFITGSGLNSITSSIFHTVFDQDYTLQTSNEIFDMTVGVFSGSNIVTTAEAGMSADINGKLLFPSESLMMREKVNIYKQFAQSLLGDASKQFKTPFSADASTTANIDSALFLCFKRLFVRDGIKRESFAMKLFSSSSGDSLYGQNGIALSKWYKGAGGDRELNGNLEVTAAHPATGSIIITDVGSAGSIERSEQGGDVGNIVLASDTSQAMGLMFYQQGIAVLDMKKIFDGNQVMSGTLPAVGATGNANLTGSFIPHFIMSASIDSIIDHVSETRFGSGSNTFLTFQNNTQINSTLVFCRATADEFNYSSNPSYINTEGRIIVIDETQQGVQKSFSFVTTIGLYDSNEQLLAVAKLSRPVEKNDEKDLTFRVRLDF
jgi:hypothetical protein